ncbi:MAG TPA: hypothetical protein VE690_06605, partial [Rhodopila sp.]|nr:hypothetical protein [Rhodopila sp.]
VAGLEARAERFQHASRCDQVQLQRVDAEQRNITPPTVSRMTSTPRPPVAWRTAAAKVEASAISDCPAARMAKPVRGACGRRR